MHFYESKREEEKKKRCIGSFEGEVSHKEEVATLEKNRLFFFSLFLCCTLCSRHLKSFNNTERKTKTIKIKPGVGGGGKANCQVKIHVPNTKKKG